MSLGVTTALSTALSTTRRLCTRLPGVQARHQSAACSTPATHAQPPHARQQIPQAQSRFWFLNKSRTGRNGFCQRHHHSSCAGKPPATSIHGEIILLRPTGIAFSPGGSQKSDASVCFSNAVGLFTFRQWRNKNFVA